MMNTDKLTGLSVLLLCWIGVAAMAYPGGDETEEDCLPRGPRFNDVGTDIPVIMDLGSAAGSNGAGCDGCVIDWDIVVIWQHDGDGFTVDWDDQVEEHKVEAGEMTYFVGTDFMTCNSDSIFDASSPTGTTSMWYECLACQ